MSAESVTSTDNMAFLFSCFANLKDDGKINWDAVAVDIGIKFGRNVPPRFNRIANAFGYKHEQGKCVRIDEAEQEQAGDGDGDVVPTPRGKKKKATTTTKNKRTRAMMATEEGSSSSTARKRRKTKQEVVDVEDDVDGEVDGDEIGEDEEIDAGQD